MANPQITFFNLSSDDSNYFHQLLVEIVSERYSKGKRIAILCPTEDVMYALDEMLWQLDPNRFLAHSLASEPVANKAPIVLMVNGDTINQRFSCWVNLTTTACIPIPQTQEIIEFVPHQDSLKQAARERYKAYCQQGIKPLFKDPTASQ